MEKVLVTGVSGFIGSYLAERLVAEGYTVAGLLRHSNRLNYPAVQRLLGRVTMYYGSLIDARAVYWMMADFKPDFVCHLGAITPVAYSFDHPQEVTETNYLGTINLVESAMRECPHLKKFIFASSMETYGFQTKQEAFVETDESRPACPYAVAKVACEKYLQYLHYAYKFPAVLFRQTNCFGRRENDYFVIEAIITQMLRSNEVNLGDPRPWRNFLFVDDLVEAYLAVMRSNESGLLGEVFNTGPDNALTIQDLVGEIARMLAWEGKINWYTRPRRPGEIFYLNSSNEKITRTIGWKPKVSLEEGLERTINLWRENPQLVAAD